MHLAELDLVHDVLVGVPLLLAGRVLGDLLDLDFAILSDNFLDVELEEAIKTSNLLGDESVLLEVGLDHGPGVDGVDHLITKGDVLGRCPWLLLDHTFSQKRVLLHSACCH